LGPAGVAASALEVFEDGVTFSQECFEILECCQVTRLAFSFCSDLGNTWPYFCPSRLYLHGKPLYRPVISEQWAVFLGAVAVCKLSAHMGWLSSSSLPCEGSRADGTPCSLGLTGCVFGKCEQMVMAASWRRNTNTS